MPRKGKKKKGRGKASKNNIVAQPSVLGNAKDEVEHLIDDISLAINSSSLLKSKRSLSSVSQSTLNDCLEPIRQALERIDAQRLLHLDIILPSQEEETAGPRLRDG